MNKLLKGLLVTALVVGTVNADTNKTFLMPRSAGVNLPMEYTTFNELIQHKNGDFFGAHFQVVPFYMDSTNGSDIGKYFGIAGKNTFVIGNSTLVTAGTADMNYGYIIHNIATAATAGVATLNFDPELQAYGARIDYYQDLEKILDGLYLKVALPIVHTETKINRTVSSVTASNNLTEAHLNEYFAGTYSQDIADANAQAVLEHAKRDGSHSETSVADIDVVLGYKIWDKEKYSFALNLGLTIPVGNDADGDWAFEPIVGNGDHWGFGGGLDAMVRLWKKNDQDIKLTLAANYRYLFSGTEKRTLGLNDVDGVEVPFGQYYLAATIGDIRRTQQLQPVANLLTQDVKVETGSQLDAELYFTYNNGGWNVELGYNLFYKDSEDVSLKNAWSDGVYGIAFIDQTFATGGDGTFVASADGTAAVGANGGSRGLINNTPTNTALGQTTRAYGINTHVAESASQFTNKIFGGVGYIFREWEYPMMLNISGAYEFADRDAIENWQIWGKIGVKF
ncbi:MAG: hypothetical protein SZ59_C0004G0020 [candidate division TM6 bacterium GW2011_GWF2_28_16]|nr:MAG: hypothetical protein SZ59_C0004G0020 [candidate division TM6 bacterium GW2011_GWF2_28_16]